MKGQESASVCFLSSEMALTELFLLDFSKWFFSSFLQRILDSWLAPEEVKTKEMLDCISKYNSLPAPKSLSFKTPATSFLGIQLQTCEADEKILSESLLPTLCELTKLLCCLGQQHNFRILVKNQRWLYNWLL